MKPIKNILILALVFGVLAANFAHAVETLDEASCSAEDVSPPLGPLRNQGNIGWCYANVAADLITFRYQDQLKGKRASAGFIAITFNGYLKSRPNDDAGLITPAVIFSELNGICPQEVQDYKLKGSPFKTIREQINGLVYLKQEYEKYRKGDQASQYLSILSRYRSSNSNLNELTDYELEEVLKNSSNRNFPRKLADRLCRLEKVKVKADLQMRFQIGFIEGWKNIVPSFFKNKKFIAAPLVGKENLIEEVHEEIGRKNMVAVSYDTRIFLDEEQAEKKLPGLHASSIVGRRWNSDTKTCELKLRNSWGVSCERYTNPVLKGNCDPETGYVWIPDTLLMQTISDMAYYKSKK